MNEKTKTKGSVLGFVEEYGVLIALGVVSLTAGYFGIRYVYNTGGIHTVNQLLRDGTIVWSDGCPVIVKGRVISGDPNWVGNSILNGAIRG